MKIHHTIIVPILYCLLFTACTNEDPIAEQPIVDQNTSSIKERLFTKLDASQTGIQFINYNKEANEYNYYTYEYFYNGGGVAVADFNNDGLQDIYFTANMAPNQLYINKGDLKFQEISATAGVNSVDQFDWCTGVTVVDINNDGWQDIYVCRSGDIKNVDLKRENLLFVNNGNLTFTERAAEYGLAHNGFSTQASFFDYDKDGDLDMYLLNHPRDFFKFGKTAIGQLKLNDVVIQEIYSDRLFENKSGKYVDVTKSLGMENWAHGLGIMVSDLNNDGWQDIYVANDYSRPDYLLMNQKGKGFKNEANTALKHMPKFAMGVDVADINNDGYQDVFTVEMLAADNYRKKTNMAAMNPELYEGFVKSGLHYQNMHNCLQMNNGDASFSEIAWMSGVAETDWSWCPLFADLDNDGLTDLYVTNGYKRDMMDKDFVKSTDKILSTDPNQFNNLMNQIPASTIPNYVFKNEGDLTFTNMSQDWGLFDIVNSNGAAYADFDNDGDLDIVVNNLESTATFYRNNSKDKNYVRFSLKNGPALAYGAKVELMGNAGYQMKELTNVHGFQSSSEQLLHFGLNDYESVDSVWITWVDGTRSLLEDVASNKVHIIDKKQSAVNNSYPKKKADPLFKEVKQIASGYLHRESEYNDYEREVLLPHKLSEEGAQFAVGDVNNDGLDDFFIGNGSGYVGSLMLQTENGFKESNQGLLGKDRMSEDAGALFFDFDGDKDLDLYVVSGSNELDVTSTYMQDRLYENDGKGVFSKTEGVLPKMPASGSCVKAADYDKDGDLDLFVGGFQIPGKYPQHGTSYVLNNEGGIFKDVTNSLNANLSKIGMVKDALWEDLNNDGNLELIVAGHWMPITVFSFVEEKMENSTERFGLKETNGWWNTLASIDANADGFKDIVAGNLGLNSKHKATVNEPFQVYAADFDGNGNNDIALGYYNNGICYPVRGRQCTAEQVPAIGNKIPTFKEFGNANLEQVYGIEALKQAYHGEVYIFASSLFINEKGASFMQENLPNTVQVSSVNTIAVADVNADGISDLILAGNQYAVEVETGRYDASRGAVLLGKNDHTFKAVLAKDSGLNLDEEITDVKVIEVNQTTVIVAAAKRNQIVAFHVL